MLLLDSFSGLGFRNTVYAADASAVPKLLITEIVFNTTNSEGKTTSSTADPFEFIELYNASDNSINLNGYSVVYNQTNAAIATAKIEENITIEPTNTIVLWLYNSESVKQLGSYSDASEETNEKFRTHYQAKHYNYPIYRADATSFSLYDATGTSYGRKLHVVSDDGLYICSVLYNTSATKTNVDANEDQSVTYKYPGTSVAYTSFTYTNAPKSVNLYQMTKLGTNQTPTPGIVTTDQVPAGDYDDTVAPVIVHEQPMTNMPKITDLKISATVTDETYLSNTYLYYQTYGSTVVNSVYKMEASSSDINIYQYTIPADKLTDATYMKYYIATSDGYNVTMSPSDDSFYTIDLIDNIAPTVNITSPADGYAFKSFYKPEIIAEYSDTTGIDTTSVKLSLNDKDITADAVVSETGITYTHDTDLAIGEYTVSLEVYDKSTYKNYAKASSTFSITDQIPKIPEILITELLPNSSGPNGGDNYEFVELYNSSDNDINLKNYKLMYMTDPTVQTYLTDDITEDAIVKSGETAIIWFYNQNCVADFGAYESITDDIKNKFREQYGLSDDSSASEILIYAVNANMNLKGLNYFTLQNSGAKTLLLAKDDGEFICEADYVGSVEDTSDIFKYPSDDSVLMKVIGQDMIPTPGSITYEQKPINYDDPTAPVITYGKPLNEMNAGDIKITAMATDETDLRYVRLYYETYTTSETKNADMVLSQTNTYEYTIPEADVSGSSYINYYFEASDGLHNVTCPANKNDPFVISITDCDGPVISIVSPVQNNSFVNYYKPVIKATFSDATGIDKSSVKLYLNNQDITANAEISVTNSVYTSANIVYTPVTNLTAGKYTIKLEVSDSSIKKNQSIKEWAYTISTAESAGPAIPELLITEAIGNPTSGFDANNKLIRTNYYEFVELYNASNQDINLKDYKLMYIANIESTDDIKKDDIKDDIVLYPGQAIAVWIYNSYDKTYFGTGDSSTLDVSVKAELIAKFKERYNMEEGLAVIMVDADSATSSIAFNIDNTVYGKTIMVAKDDAASGEYISTANYNDDPDLNYDVMDKSMTYTYPIDNSIKMAVLKAGANPTPGTVTYAQIPYNYFDKVNPVISHSQTVTNMEPVELTISATVTDETQLRYAKLYYETFNTDGMVSIEMTESQSGTENYEAIIPASDITGSNYVKYYIEASDGLNTVTSPTQNSTPYTISVTDTQGPVVKNVKPADKYYIVNDYRPVISVEYSDASGIESAKLYLDSVDITEYAVTTDSGITYTPGNDLADGNHTVLLKLTDASTAKNQTEKTWTFVVGQEIYNFYKGQIHSHSNYSDGMGAPEDAYLYARDKSKVDFFGITDHAHYIDQSEWKELKDIADKYNDPDKYVTIPGFELTWDSTMGWWGHMNTFNTDWIEAKRNNSTVNLPNYYEKLIESPESISQFNHPGYLWGDFAEYDYYSEEADEVIDLMEVKTLEHEAEYAKALDKGWHISPTFNEDNHSGNWAKTANTTVVLAPRLTRENLLDAINKNRTYSTQDKNLEITYKINDKIMGSTLDDPEKLSLSIEAYRPIGNIGTITVVADGHSIVATQEFDTNQVNWEFELPALYSYYYVRIVMPNGTIAVTAPIWVENAKPLELSNVDVGNNSDNAENPVQIKSNATNSGETAITDVKIEYFRTNTLDSNKISEKSIGTVESGKDIAVLSNIPFVSLDRTIYLKVTGKIADVTVSDVKAINIPEILITEIMPASSLGEGDTVSPYEFIEIYNNSDKTIDIADYKIEYFTGSGKAVVKYDITNSKLVQPKGTLVVWLKSVADSKTVNDFNARYGTSLTDEQIVEYVGGILGDTEGKTLFITHDTSAARLSQARYNMNLGLENDVASDLSIQYEYPTDGTDILEKIAPEQTPTPGSIALNQVPYIVDPTDATLRSIELSDGELTPAFSPSITSYTASVKHGVSGITITPTVSAAGYTSMTVNDNALVSGNSYNADLDVRENTFVIKVTAENNVDTQTYTIVVNRARSSNNGNTGTDTDTDIKPTEPSVSGPVITIEKPVLDDKTGQAKAVIDEKTLADALALAKTDADGTKTAKAEISKVEGATSYTIVIPNSFLTAADAIGKLELETEFGIVMLPSKMLDNANIGTDKEIYLSIGVADKDKLTEKLKDSIGNRPVIELNMITDGKILGYNNPDAPVTVKIPYTPTAEELKNPEHIVIWYIDGQGKAIAVPNGRYDAATGNVVFTTTHFSQFAVAYVFKTFDDIVGYEWARDSIEVMASKGVINGVSEKAFNPESNISRADFTLLLIKALGLTAKVDSNFEDISKDAYYYEAVGIAKKLGMVKGLDNNTFDPDTEITRQEMLVISARAMKAANKLNAVGTSADLAVFTDTADIADYAVNEIAVMVKEGLIKGSDNKINPLDNTTRAETAVLIYRIYNK